MNKLTILIALLAALLVTTGLQAQENEAKLGDPGPALEKNVDYYAVLHTSMGRIVLDLYEDKTPFTVQNFVNLAEGTKPFKDPARPPRDHKRYYDGVIFHRVMNEFMIQSGDPSATSSGGPGYTIRDEIDSTLTFDLEDGLLAMANTGRPNSGAAQFFITDKDSFPGYLNGGYTIFGKTVEGLDVVDAISNVKVTYQPAMPRIPQNHTRPVEPVLIRQAQIIRVPSDAPEGAWKGKVLDIPLDQPYDPQEAPKAPESKPATKPTTEPATRPATKPATNPAPERQEEQTRETQTR